MFWGFDLRMSRFCCANTGHMRVCLCRCQSFLAARDSKEGANLGGEMNRRRKYPISPVHFLVDTRFRLQRGLEAPAVCFQFESLL
jgi:hypothetical protein